MKLISLFGLAAVASADYLKLDLVFKNVDKAITIPDVVKTSLPWLIESAAEKLAPDANIQNYLKMATNLKFSSTFAAPEATVSLAFPLVPQQYFDAIKAAYTKVVASPDVQDVLTSVIPRLLCGTCEFSSAGVTAVTSGTPPPTSGPARPKPVWHKLGLKIQLSGQSAVIPQAKIDPLVGLIGAVLKSQFQALKTLGASDSLIRILDKLVSQISITNSPLNAVNIMLNGIPTSYVELYKPVAVQYIIDNQDVIKTIKDTLPSLWATITGQTGVSAASLAIIDEVVTQQPTAVPTATPTAVPTATPTTVPPTGTATPTTVPPTGTATPTTVPPTSTNVAPTSENTDSSSASFTQVSIAAVFAGVVALLL